MDYLSMGGYAAYVWPSYAIAAAILLGLLISSWRSARSGEAEVERLRALGADPRRPQSAAAATADPGEQA